MILTLNETIAAPRNEVWHHLTDPGSMTRWMNGVDEMRTADGGPLAAGAQIEFIARGKTRHTQVTEFEPLHRLIMHSTQGPVTATYVYTLTDGAGENLTIAQLQADCTVRGWMRMLMPLLKFAIRRADGNQLSDLKRIVEDRVAASVAGENRPGK